MDSNKSTKHVMDLESVHRRANDLFTDIKAEVLAASLIEQGYLADHIFMTREGAARRGWNKDIDELQVEYSQYDLKDYLYIKTNRPGIYDILPEGIFHGVSPSRKITRYKEDIIDEIKAKREEEFFVRRFFRLFEQEIDTSSIKAYLYEAKYDKKMGNPDFINIFISYWPIIKLLNHRQAIFFLHTIPLISTIRNKFNEIASSMSLILDVPVNIEQVKILHKAESNEVQSELGSIQLGVDWIQGRSFDDGLFDLKVTIGPISGDDMRTYLGNGKGSIILDYLCNILIPGNIFIVKDYIIDQKESIFKLSDENHTSYLGINTFL